MKSTSVVLRVLLLMCAAWLSSCYSFTGASVPTHLKTIEIVGVQVEAQYGNPPLYQDMLTADLVEELESNSSLRLVESNGDATLDVEVISIRETAAGSAQVETETERSLEIVLRVEYYDRIKSKQIWTKQFTQKTTFAVSGGQVERDATIEDIIEYAVEDIILAVVSGW